MQFRIWITLFFHISCLIELELANLVLGCPKTYMQLELFVNWKATLCAYPVNWDFYLPPILQTANNALEHWFVWFHFPTTKLHVQSEKRVPELYHIGFDFSVWLFEVLLLRLVIQEGFTGVWNMDCSMDMLICWVCSSYYYTFSEDSFVASWLAEALIVCSLGILFAPPVASMTKWSVQLIVSCPWSVIRIQSTTLSPPRILVSGQSYEKYEDCYALVAFYFYHVITWISFLKDFSQEH